MPLRAALFDIGGVLALAPDGTEPADEFDALFARWDARQGTGRAIASFLESRRADASLGRITVAAWEAGLAEAGRLDADGLARFVHEFWDLYLGAWNEPLGAWIAANRPRLRVGLLSNSGIGAREREEARYGLAARVDTIVYSHEEGIAKPNRRIYELACGRLKTIPHEMVFVDDIPANIDAACALGMQGVLFRDTAETLRRLDALVRA
jgi:FMN phosphatase YigB (HAD superfamily)